MIFFLIFGMFLLHFCICNWMRLLTTANGLHCYYDICPWGITSLYLRIYFQYDGLFVWYSPYNTVNNYAVSIQGTFSWQCRGKSHERCIILEWCIIIKYLTLFRWWVPFHQIYIFYCFAKLISGGKSSNIQKPFNNPWIEIVWIVEENYLEIILKWFALVVELDVVKFVLYIFGISVRLSGYKFLKYKWNVCPALLLWNWRPA